MLRTTLGRAPRGLLALCVLGCLLAVAWSVVTPPLQGPDEPAHVAYVQALAENGALPGDPGRGTFSTDLVLAWERSNADQAPADDAIPLSWRPEAFEAWAAAAADLPAAARADGGGPNPAAANPPLSYLTGAVAYAAASDGDFFDRLAAVRLASVLWLPLAVLGVWLLAGELLASRRAQVAAAALPALAPMSTFVFGIVIPDGPLIALWSIALWLGTRVLRRPPSAWWGLALGVVVGLAVLVKATSYALVPAALLALAIAGARGRRLRVPAAGVAGLAVTAGTWLVLARADAGEAAPAGAGTAQVAEVTGASFSAREVLSYLWQFYLPRPWFQQDFPSVAPTLPAYDLMFKQAWAAFGWTEVLFAEWVYVLLLLVSAVAVAAAGRHLWQVRRRLERRVVAFLALVVLCLLGGLHLTDYVVIDGGRVNFIQGRYLLVLIGVAGLVPGVLLRHRGALALGVWLTGLLTLNLASLGLVLWRYGA